MSRLSVDDFEWLEEGFDTWYLHHKIYSVTIAAVRNYHGWHVSVLADDSQYAPLHVDSLDAAKALAQIIATQHMEFYHAKYLNHPKSARRRVKSNGPPAFRPGVFKVD